MRRVMTRAEPPNSRAVPRNRAPQAAVPTTAQNQTTKETVMIPANVRAITHDTAPMVPKGTTIKTIVREPKVQAPKSKAGIKEC